MTGSLRPSASSDNDAQGNNHPQSSTLPSLQPLPSPCLIHSGLHPHPYTSHPTSSHRHRSGPSASEYFDAPSPSADVTTSRRGSTSAESTGTDTTTRTFASHQDRRRASHRGPRGAAEPESGDDEDDARHQRHLFRRKSSKRKVPLGSPGEALLATPLSGDESYNDTTATTSSSDSSSSESHSEDDEDDRVRSLTRQLAETAVGVREMSKQLGRARVKSTINSVLIITKARDNHLIKLTRELALFLMLTPRNGKDRGIVVYVDSQLKTSKRFDAQGIQRDHPDIFEPFQGSKDSPTARHRSTDSSSASSSSSSSSSAEGQLRYWTADMCSRSPHLFDFVVTLGGDGTVLFCSWLFQRIVPPVLPFALGSLGFLTNFDFSDYPKVMSSAIDQGIRVNLRMRFTATVYRATLPPNAADLGVDKQRRRAIKSGRTGEIIMRNVKEGGWERIEKPEGAACGTVTTGEDDKDQGGTERTGKPDIRPKTHKKDREVMCFSTRPVETFEVLNDLVVDRGPSPYVSLLEIFGDEHHMTTAQADGLCISTPTGSTAYSLSAGGSLVHPEIPAILITPICPHTLSFRPMLLPDSMELRIAVPYNSRSTAWASFDGRGRVELKQGDHIKVTASRYPFPTVCRENQSTDWFQSIGRTLKWNERQRQKSFVVVEEGGDNTSSRKRGAGGADGPSKEASGKTGKDSSQRRKDLPTVVDQPSESQPASESPGHASKTSGGPSSQGAPVDSDDDDDDDADEDGDDGEDEEEAFDIDDTSTVTTAANTRAHTPVAGHPNRTASSNGVGNVGNSAVVDAMSSSIGSIGSRSSDRQSHQHGGSHGHHHHHGHSSHSAPVSHRSSFSRLSRLVPFTSDGGSSSRSSAAADDAIGGTAGEGGDEDRIEFDAPPGSARSNERRDDKRRRPSASRGHHPHHHHNHHHHRNQPANRDPNALHGTGNDRLDRQTGILDSPDRFSAAGPPDPPRAISKRHLTTADFRLDDGGEEQQGASQTATNPKARSRSRSRSRSGKSAARGDSTDTHTVLESAEKVLKDAAKDLDEKPITPGSDQLGHQASIKEGSDALKQSKRVQLPECSCGVENDSTAGPSSTPGTHRNSSDGARQSSSSSGKSRRRSQQQKQSKGLPAADEGSGAGAGSSSGSGGNTTALVVYGEDSSSDEGSETDQE